MQLVLNTFGIFLSKDGNCFSIKSEGTKKKVSAKKVESILITTGASFSTDAVELAVENNIDIVFLNKYGNPIARIWQPKLGSITTIRRKQIELYEKNEGLVFALEWIKKKAFELILLDIMMPQMDGFEVCRKIRHKQKFNDLPVLFLTAKLPVFPS